LERFQLKLNTKARETFEQIRKRTQERLASDQIKVNLLLQSKTTNELLSSLD